MSNLLLLQFFIPLLNAIFCLLLKSYRRIQLLLSAISMFIYTACSAYLLKISSLEDLEIYAGGWLKEYSIGLKSNPFSLMLIFVTGLLCFCTIIYSSSDHSDKTNDISEKSSKLYPSLSFLIFGITGALLTNDIFNLYVWFEVILLSSFTIFTLDREKTRMIASYKYVLINLISSLLLLLGIGLVYSVTGTLHFDEIQALSSQFTIKQKNILNIMSVIIFVALGIKSSLVPFHMWLPATYHKLSPSLSGLYAGLLTKVGLYALFKVLIFILPMSTYLKEIIYYVAPTTVIVGVLGAIIQDNMRRILSFHVVSQVGFIAIGAYVMTSANSELQKLGIIATAFYMIHHMIVKTNLFFIVGIIKKKFNTEFTSKVSGVRKLGFLSLLFCVPALSLAGIPPFSGFWAKLLLFKAAIQIDSYFLILAMIVGGLLTLFSMLKIWTKVFWGIQKENHKEGNVSCTFQLIACIILTLGTLTLSFYPNFVFEYSESAFNSLVYLENK